LLLQIAMQYLNDGMISMRVIAIRAIYSSTYQL